MEPLPDYISIFDDYHLAQMTLNLRLLDFLRENPDIRASDPAIEAMFEKLSTSVGELLQGISNADRNRLLETYTRQQDVPMFEEWERLLKIPPPPPKPFIST